MLAVEQCAAAEDVIAEGDEDICCAGRCESVCQHLGAAHVVDAYVAGMLANEVSA